MPWTETFEDLSTLRSIDYWHEVVPDAVDDIGAWRDQHTEKVFPQERHGNGQLKQLYTHTSMLVAWISRKFPMIDATAILDVYTAIDAWYTDRNADRIPDQRLLEAQLDRAMIVMETVVQEIYSRSTNSPPKGHLGDGAADGAIPDRPKHKWYRRRCEVPDCGGRMLVQSSGHKGGQHRTRWFKCDRCGERVKETVTDTDSNL